jgi:CDP-paratose 2-epimerase
LLERIEGIRVVGIDNLIRPGAETNRTRIERLGIEFIHGDLRSASEVARLPACELGDRRSRQPQRPASPVREAAASFLNITSPLLEYCRQHRSGLLLLSSSRVYSIPALTAIPLIVQNQAFVVDPAAALPAGLTADGIGVDFCTAAPVSLYGATKLASEIMALEYGSAFDFPVWITRCGVLAGAGQFGTPDQGIFAYWVNAHLRRRPMRYIGFNGTGHQTRETFHPRDPRGPTDCSNGYGPL